MILKPIKRGKNIDLNKERKYNIKNYNIKVERIVKKKSYKRYYMDEEHFVDYVGLFNGVKGIIE